MAARNKQKSDAAVQELGRLGARAAFISVDVEKESSCRALIASTIEKFGKVNILVNNAGIALPKTPEEYTSRRMVEGTPGSSYTPSCALRRCIRR